MYVCMYVCMSFFLLSHYPQNFPLNSADRQVLVIDAYCVFCEVGNELFNVIIYMTFVLPDTSALQAS
jgi:hypothetical protein